MKLIFKSLLIVSLALVLSGFLAACSGSAATTPLARANGAAADSSIFQVSTLAVNPAEVNPGVESMIAAKVTNNGPNDRIYQPNVTIVKSGEPSLPSFLPASQVNIKAGATQLVSLTTTLNTPGTYQVCWGNLKENLVVNRAETGVTGNSSIASLAPAPDFTGVDVVTGKTVSLKQYSGKLILLNFVNYGCAPSTNNIVSAQLLAIKQLQQQRSDFVPVSIFCGCCPPDVLRQFAKENSLNWPWILDTDYSIASKYAGAVKQYGYPTLVFIDKNQQIAEVSGLADIDTLNASIDNIAQN